MSSSSTTSSVHVGFGGLLFLVFLVLKLTGVIAWSWWWVMAPLWVPVAICLGIVIGGFVGLLTTDIVRSRNRRRK